MALQTSEELGLTSWHGRFGFSPAKRRDLDAGGLAAAAFALEALEWGAEHRALLASPSRSRHILPPGSCTGLACTMDGCSAEELVCLEEGVELAAALEKIHRSDPQPGLVVDTNHFWRASLALEWHREEDAQTLIVPTC